MERYDFSGWATKNDLLCSDGRTIKQNAFKHNDGEVVPLVWNHNHSAVDNILGHALLENRDEGVYAYCTFNDSKAGKDAKELVKHGDIRSLSIYANRLKQNGNDVVHGIIREVSLVVGGANPGAFIDSVLAHGDDGEEIGIVVNYDENIMLYHSDESTDKKKKNERVPAQKATENNDDEEETVQDVFDTLNDKQKEVVYAIVGQALEDAGVTDEEDKDEDEDDKKGNKSMKHNIFSDQNEDRTETNYISHSDQQEILKLAKNGSIGSFQNAFNMYLEDNELTHAENVGGFVQNGDGNVTLLFPEYKDVRPGEPELITNDQGWISNVMNKVHKSPISRIRTGQVDIRKIDELRAKGYKKGEKKSLTGNFKLVRRTTDPQTVYVKNALHRDDIIDIVDFDYVQYLYKIDRMMLNEELATAIMLGDGRDDGDPDRISPEHIRPIWLDDDLYTIHADIDFEAAKKELQGTYSVWFFVENYITAEAMINTVLYTREKYKGTGTPDMYITPHMLNVMLLARDMNGRRIYSSKTELAAALNVGNIITAEQFEGQERTDKDTKKHKLVAIIANLNDYSLGSTKGGEITHFTQFDIDFNQEKSLLETRCSGALTRVYSAIAIEEKVGE